MKYLIAILAFATACNAQTNCLTLLKTEWSTNYARFERQMPWTNADASISQYSLRVEQTNIPSHTVESKFFGIGTNVAFVVRTRKAIPIEHPEGGWVWSIGTNYLTGTFVTGS